MYLDGSVVNNTGSPGASGMLVVAHCSNWHGSWADAVWYSTYSSDWAAYTHLASNGAFSLAMTAVSGGYQEVCDEAGVTAVVSVFTYAASICDYYNLCASGSAWGGVGAWNASFVVWDRPYIGATVPANYVGPLYPIVLDFSTAPNGYSELNFEQSATLSTTLSSQWSLAGGVGVLGSYGESSETTVANSVGAGIGGSNGSLDWVADYHTSGILGFSAITRAWARTAIEFGTPVKQNYAATYGLAPPSDWLTPANVSKISDAYYVTGFNGVTMHALPVQPGKFDYGYVTTSTSTSSTSTLSVQFSLSYGLEGVIPISGTLGEGWSQTSSTGSSDTLYWQAGGTGTTQWTCYDVYGEAGTFSNPVSTADMVGIYSWPATYYSGNTTWGCP